MEARVASEVLTDRLPCDAKDFWAAVVAKDSVLEEAAPALMAIKAEAMAQQAM